MLHCGIAMTPAGVITLSAAKAEGGQKPAGDVVDRGEDLVEVLEDLAIGEAEGLEAELLEYGVTLAVLLGVGGLVVLAAVDFDDQVGPPTATSPPPPGEA